MRQIYRYTAMVLCAVLVFCMLTACSGPSAQKPVNSTTTDVLQQSQEVKTPTKETDEGFIQEREGYTATTHWVMDASSKTKIFGYVYKPIDFQEDKQYPVVIFSHGIGVTNSDFDLYIPYFMKLGVICYAFDFPGGSMQSKSKGDVKAMSVLTEKEALKTVLADIRGQSFTDTSKVVLMGGSQGGVVTGLTAVETADQIAGEILLYPALAIVDNAKAKYPSLDDVPDNINVRGLTLGKVYYEDVWDLDLSAEVSKYSGSVLLIHGTADSSVPYEYSVNVQPMFSNAKLVTVEDGDHGFTDDEIRAFFPEVEQYLTALGVI